MANVRCALSFECDIADPLFVFISLWLMRTYLRGQSREPSALYRLEMNAL